MTRYIEKKEWRAEGVRLEGHDSQGKDINFRGWGVPERPLARKDNTKANCKIRLLVTRLRSGLQ